MGTSKTEDDACACELSSVPLVLSVLVSSVSSVCTKIEVGYACGYTTLHLEPKGWFLTTCTIVSAIFCPPRLLGSIGLAKSDAPVITRRQSMTVSVCGCMCGAYLCVHDDGDGTQF